MSTEGKELLKQWGIDEKYVGIGNCIFGYGKDQKLNREKIIIFIVSRNRKDSFF